MIEVLTTTPYVTVQDLGRFGHLADGVPRAGAADHSALSAGNLALGNAVGLAGIELPRSVISLLFHTHATVALTGAPLVARLGRRRMDGWVTFGVLAGQVLEIEPRPGGTYSYLTVAGGVDVPEVLGSRSTQLRGSFGGHRGRALQSGDHLPIGKAALRFPTCRPIVPPPRDNTAPFRVIPAAEYDYLDPESRDVFWQSAWRVTPQSNRAGHRLAGPQLAMPGVPELRSHGIVPGIIQLPKGGQLVVQMSDAATMGGYPKVGTIVAEDLDRFAQVPPGQQVWFLPVQAPVVTSEAAWLSLLEDQSDLGPEADLASLDLLASIEAMSGGSGGAATDFSMTRISPGSAMRLRRGTRSR